MRTKKGIKEKRRPAFRFERCGFVPLTFREPLRFLLTEGVFQNASLHLASVSKLHLRTRERKRKNRPQARLCPDILRSRIEGSNRQEEAKRHEIRGWSKEDILQSAVQGESFPCPQCYAQALQAGLHPFFSGEKKGWRE